MLKGKNLPTAQSRGGEGADRMMPDVIIALAPAVIVSVVLSGVQALLVLMTFAAGAVAGEAVFNLCVRKQQTVLDGSAVVTGLVLGLSLNANVPLWQCAVGAVFAVVVVKGLFGGLGKNLVNPAAAAHVFMLLAFTAVGGGAGGVSRVIALAVGGVYLVVRKGISWYVPLFFTGTVLVCFLALTGSPTTALEQVLAGNVVLGAVFMAGDCVTIPTTKVGRALFGVGAGLLTFALRQSGVQPDGVAVAILVMNLFTPFLEDWTAKKEVRSHG